MMDQKRLEKQTVKKKILKRLKSFLMFSNCINES